MTDNPIDRNKLQELLEKYEIVETVMLRLSKLERTPISSEPANDVGSGLDLKQIGGYFKLLDEVMESIGAVEIQIDQLEFRVNSAEKLLNPT